MRQPYDDQPGRERSRSAGPTGRAIGPAARCCRAARNSRATFSGRAARRVPSSAGATTPPRACARASRSSAASRMIACATLLAALPSVIPPAYAEYDPAREYVETAAVAARYPDPPIDLPTPGFVAGKADFTSQREMEAFVERLAVALARPARAHRRPLAGAARDPAAGLRAGRPPRTAAMSRETASRRCSSSASSTATSLRAVRRRWRSPGSSPPLRAPRCSTA